MTREELQKRLVKVKGRPLPDRAITIDARRRGQNYVEAESNYEADEFDNFFDFEEDLSDMESARRQVERLRIEELINQNSQPATPDSTQPVFPNNSIVFESETDPEPALELGKSGQDDSFFVLDDWEVEEAEESIETENAIANTKSAVYTDPIEDGKPKYDQVIGFNFEYCAYIKEDGDRCRRQAPKGGQYCKTHRKYLENNQD